MTFRLWWCFYLFFLRLVLQTQFQTPSDSEPLSPFSRNPSGNPALSTSLLYLEYINIINISNIDIDIYQSNIFLLVNNLRLISLFCSRPERYLLLLGHCCCHELKFLIVWNVNMWIIWNSHSQRFTGWAVISTMTCLVSFFLLFLVKCNKFSKWSLWVRQTDRQTALELFERKGGHLDR